MRDALSPELRAQHSAAAASHVVALLARAPPACLAAFVAMGSEIDPSAVLVWAAGRGIPTAVPMVAGDRMTFALHAPSEPLVDGVFGTRQPVEGAVQASPDVWLVPLLGFDARGGRLGYGAGHYDRAIARTIAAGLRPRLIGFAFSAQEVDRVPLEGHDQRLDAVVTELGIRTFGPAVRRRTTTT